MIYSMGDTGVISSRWAAVHKKRTPRAATYAVAFAACILSLLGGLEILAEATNALVYLMFLIVNIVVIILRQRQPETPRPFRVSFAIGLIPVVPCLGIIATLALSLQLEMRPLLVAVGLLFAGLALYTMDTARR